MVIDTRRVLWVLIGAFLAGLPGAVIAWFLSGVLLPQVRRSSHAWGGFGRHQTDVQAVFFEATFQVMGHVAKADGRVSEREIEHARQVMTQMGLGEADKKRAIQFFGQGKAANFDLDGTLSRLQRVCGWQFVLKRLFVQIQIQAAQADGAVSYEQQKILEYIARTIGVGQADAYSYQNQEQQSHRYGSGASSYSSRQSLREAYKVLGVQESVSQAELKGLPEIDESISSR